MTITLPWASIKAKELPLSYAETRGNYYIYCRSDSTDYSCVLLIGSTNGLDFETNYKATATSLM